MWSTTARRLGMPQASLRFEIELIGWEVEVRKEDLSAEERVAHATRLKEEGTALYKQDDFARRLPVKG